MTMFSMPVSSRLAMLIRSVSILSGLLLVPALSLGQTFVQENNNKVAVNATSVSVTYTTAETAGDLNVVVVGWNDTTSSVTSVVDDNTNTYVLVGTTSGNGLSQAIYYARNIVLPTNTTPTVTVNFNQNAGFPDVRILEYSGLSTTAPLDNWAGNSGVSALADSGAATTTTSDLILGAGTTGAVFSAAGAGFTSRVITTPFGDIVEDSNGARPAASYNATATLGSSNWVMQVADFSTAGVTFALAPTVTAIVPTTGSDAGGTSVTITGTNFQPGATVLFGTAPGGISGVNCTESGGTTITCLTPSDTDGPVDVTVVNVDEKLGSAVMAYTFVNVPPATIGTIAPGGGPTNGNTAITITGTNFQVGARVTIGGLLAANVVVQSSTTITANTPGLPAGPADVTVHNPSGNITSTNGFTYSLGTGPINYIQRGDTALSGAAATVLVPMPSPQKAGDLNVVIIGWSDTVATVTAVTDTEGNTYVAALPAVTGTGVSQVIYYAKNITGDSLAPNQITVTFSQAAQSPDVRIFEYSGLDTVNPIDTAAGFHGSGALADTGPCTTTTPVELIVAGGTVASGIPGAGSGFILLDLTTDGDNAEHQITTVAGSCEATAPVNAPGPWVMQTVAFKTASTAPDFSLSALPISQTVSAGSAASYTISVTALNGFNSAVSLTCSAGLPTGASCAFVPSPVTPGLAAATSALTISTTSATPAGTTNVTVTGTSGVSHNTLVSLTVTALTSADFTIAASALSPASVSAGGSATSTITVAPLTGFTGAVSLTCSSITPVVSPAPTCAFVPSSIASGSGTSTLTVSTTAATTASLAPQSKGTFYAMWLPIAPLALLLSGFTARKKKFLCFLFGCLMFSGLIFLAACGGSSSSGGGGGGHPGTPAGTYTITVTGTSGSLTHPTTVSLTVH
jgi:hypothetical protein